jgi:hypothetical protein
MQRMKWAFCRNRRSTSCLKNMGLKLANAHSVLSVAIVLGVCRKGREDRDKKSSQSTPSKLSE